VSNAKFGTVFGRAVSGRQLNCRVKCNRTAPRRCHYCICYLFISCYLFIFYYYRCYLWTLRKFQRCLKNCYSKRNGMTIVLSLVHVWGTFLTFFKPLNWAEHRPINRFLISVSNTVEVIQFTQCIVRCDC